MGRDARREQKAALKRKKREQRVRESKAFQRAASEGGGERTLLSRVGDLPVYECVVSRGWRDRGLAHVLLARRTPGGTLVVGGYYVDPLCTGLKATAVMPNLSEEDYLQKVKPNVFNDPVEFEECPPGVARALVEGAVEYAASLGLKPHKRWDESKRLFEGIEPAPEGLTFGRGGTPCLVLRGREQAPGIKARLDRTLGPGNYLVEEIPETSDAG